LANRDREQAIYTRILAQTPSDNAVALALAVNRTAVARIHMMQSLYPQAAGELQTTVAELERLARAAPDDSSYRSKTQFALQQLGQALLVTRDLTAAALVSDRCRAMINELVLRDPTVTEWTGARLAAARLLQIHIAASRAASEGQLRLALQPSAAEAHRLGTLSLARPHYFALTRLASEAELLAGDAADLGGDPALAREFWSSARGRLQRVNIDQLASSDRSRIIVGQLDSRLAALAQSGGRPIAFRRFQALTYAW
jgi:hypothetical protein